MGPDGVERWEAGRGGAGRSERKPAKTLSPPIFGNPESACPRTNTPKGSSALTLATKNRNRKVGYFLKRIKIFFLKNWQLYAFYFLYGKAIENIFLQGFKTRPNLKGMTRSWKTAKSVDIENRKVN